MKKICEFNAVVERGADRKGFNTAGANNPKLLDQVRNRIRCKHYSIRTEQAYVDSQLSGYKVLNSNNNFC